MTATPQSTVSIDAAAQRLWDVVVIGGGPAGALAAHQLARRGRSVIVIDKTTFPRHKVCGGCFNHRSIAALQACELGELVPELGGEPIQSLRIMGRQRGVEVRLRGGYSLSRHAFDAALLSAMIQRGADFLPEVRATLTSLDGDHRVVACQQGSRRFEVAGRIILAAHGLAGMAAHWADAEQGKDAVAATGGRSPRSATGATIPGSRIGAGIVCHQGGSRLEAGKIYMACGRHGYLGAVRVEGQCVDLAAAFDPASIQRLGLGEVAAATAREAGFSQLEGLESLAWAATPLLTRSPHRIAGTRIFAVGDAAGYVEPFTGEGIAWALHGALAVAPLADRGVADWNESLCSQWTAEHRRLVRRRQWLIRSLASTMRHPWMTSTLITGLRAFPWAASPFTQWLDAVPRHASGNAWGK